MRVLLADDHRLILESVRRALEADGGFEVVAETQSGREVAALVAEHLPEVVLLDVRMPDRDGLACLAEIKRDHPEIKVVMLSASTSPDLIEKALRLGASAYVLKAVDPSDLPATIRQAMSGTVFSTLGIPGGEEPAGAKAGGLTDRELAILVEVTKGRSNEEIAKELWVTQQTVKFHLTNVYRKLGVRNRSEALSEAFRLGLVDATPKDDGQ